ncbi:MAG: ABC transporter permease [Limisphaerales bacterium]
MRALLTISANTFTELLRQPVYLLLTSASTGFIIIIAGLPYFGFGEDHKLVRDSALSVTLLAGLFGAVLTASSSVAMEIREGTALAVLAKPIDRFTFLLGKYLGIAQAIILLTILNTLATLLASRMAFDAYGDADFAGIGLFFAGIAAAYALGAFFNYFHNVNYTSATAWSQAFTIGLVFVLLAFFIKHPDGNVVDWRLIPAGALILVALLILSGIALACSTRLDTVPTLIVCSVLFLAGLVSDYFFGRAAEAGSWWGHVGYAILPNWQLFWITDAIEGEKTIEGIWTYFSKSLLYLFGYLGASLVIAYNLFEDRDLGGTQ